MTSQERPVRMDVCILAVHHPVHNVEQFGMLLQVIAILEHNSGHVHCICMMTSHLLRKHCNLVLTVWSCRVPHVLHHLAIDCTEALLEVSVQLATNQLLATILCAIEHVILDQLFHMLYLLDPSLSWGRDLGLALNWCSGIHPDSK